MDASDSTVKRLLRLTLSYEFTKDSFQLCHRVLEGLRLFIHTLYSNHFYSAKYIFYCESNIYNFRLHFNHELSILNSKCLREIY